MSLTVDVFVARSSVGIGALLVAPTRDKVPTMMMPVSLSRQTGTLARAPFKWRLLTSRSTHGSFLPLLPIFGALFQPELQYRQRRSTPGKGVHYHTQLKARKVVLG